MSLLSKRNGARGVIAVLAGSAMLLGVLASPASAITGPEDTDINALLKGGFIDVHDYSGDPFPLGEKGGEPDACDKGQPRSNFSASVDNEGTASDFEFEFAQGSSGLKVDDLLVCVELEVLNDEDLVGITDDKQVVVFDDTDPNDGPEIRVIIRLKTQGDPPGIMHECETTANTGPLYGKWEEPKEEEFPEKDPWDWQVTLANDDPFLVPAVSSTGFGGLCPILVAAGVNFALGLSSLTDVEMKWIVYEKD